jgi:hypothetical protein
MKPPFDVAKARTLLARCALDPELHATLAGALAEIEQLRRHNSEAARELLALADRCRLAATFEWSLEPLHFGVKQ